MKYKKIIIISIILLAISFIMVALSNSTFALFSNDDYANRPDTYSTGLLQIEIESKTENISLTNTLPMEDVDGLQTTPYTFVIKNIGNLDYKFDVKLLSVGDVLNSFSSQYIKLQVDNGEATTLSSITNGVIKDDITLKAGESIDISIRMWLSINTPNTELGKSFSSKIVTDGEAIYTESNYSKTTFAEYITNLYLGDAKKNVVNNDVIYSYGTSTKLMADKLGGKLEYDGGNIRYYGGYPNNYVYFNCNDYDNPTSSTCEKWRIIGVFDGKVKIVRGEVLEKNSWDKKSDGSYSNNWSDASINNLLNGSYYNNFTDATMVNNFISDSTWYVKHFSSGNYAHELYNNERNQSGQNSDEWMGKIALMYPSDYAYATDFNYCSVNVYNYNKSGCYNNNWIHLANHIDSNDSAILLSANSSINGAIWRIAYQGNIDNTGTADIVWNVMPTLYLDEDIIRVSGNGTSSNPYTINFSTSNTDRGLLIDYVRNLYLDNNPTLVTHKDDSGNKIEDYYYSTSVNLMNDGFDSNGNRTDDIKIKGNIRYYGSDPNNYIYFNCSNYDNQTYEENEMDGSLVNCERWRIVGIVDGKVKIVSLTDLPYGYISWDLTSSGEYDNNWHDSTLMTILNDGYYNSKSNNKNYYFHRDGDKDVLTGQDLYYFNTFGIKNNTRKLISDSTWYLGGYNSTSIYTNEMYSYERGDQIGANSSKTWNGKIALMYPSDYGYSFDLSTCSKKLKDYHTCNKSWVLSSLNMSGTQLLISPFGSDVFAMSGGSYGNVVKANVFYNDYLYINSGFGYDLQKFAPTLYLDPNIVLSIYGDGSIDKPYQLLVD